MLSFFSLIWVKAVPKDFKFVNWDEFVSWGANIKALTLDDAFYTNSGANGLVGGGYKGYPPGQQVMQYLLTSNTGWSERNVVWAQGLVLGLLFLAVIELEFQKFGLKKYLFLIPGITLFYFLGYSFTSIYADGLLGAFGLATYCITNEIFRNNSKKGIYLLIAPYSIIVLIKPTGIVVGTLVLFMSLIQNEILVKRNFVVEKYINEQIRRIFSKIFYPITSMLVAYISWEIYVKNQHLEKLTLVFQNPGMQLIKKFADLSSVFISRFSESIQIRIPIVHEDLKLNLLHFIIFMVIVQVCIIFYYNKINRKLLGIHSMVPMFFGLAYFAFLFILYLLFIDEYERHSGGSIKRYFGTFLLIVGSTILIEASKILFDLEWSRKPFILLLVLLQILLPPSQMKYDFTHAQPNLDLLKSRRKVESQVKIVNQFIFKKTPVYYLDQGDMGYHKNVFVYLMMPNPVNWWCWSVGNPVFTGDIWTCDKSVFEKLPENQIFVLAHNDGQFRENQNNEISIGTSDSEMVEGVYRILKKSDGKIKVALLAKF